MRSSTYLPARKPATAARKFVHGLIFLAATAPGAAAAGQIDAATLFLIRPGMTDAEVLVRAGPPDLVNPPGVAQPGVVVREASGVERWHYIPDRSEHDPHLTVITMTNGRVFDIDRIKVFSRDGLPEPPAAAPSPAPTDGEIVRKRLERTLEAAEDYARTRARLKRDDIEIEKAAAALPAQTESGTTIYRDTDEEGRVYYGDKPMDESRGFGNP